jgi:hypothetical protein
MATIVEGGSLMACAQMRSAEVTLGKEVVVHLSTVGATGKQVHVHKFVRMSSYVPPA